MKKDITRGIIGLGVLLVLYILIAFLVPFAHTATFWISFVFTLIALLLLLLLLPKNMFRVLLYNLYSII